MHKIENNMHLIAVNNFFVPAAEKIANFKLLNSENQ